MNIPVSTIIPIFNEEECLEACLKSLAKQNYKNFEIIIVDDGSTDQSKNIAQKFNIKMYCLSHKGPGSARNFGASKASGSVLVFVDADMTFSEDFIRDLTKPIFDGKSMGTFSKNELVMNQKNKWSICWNINKNLPSNRMIQQNYPDKSPVFRAILKKEFDKVHGFETNGQYTDDWSLSEKLGVKATLAPGATYYHTNPANLAEVWHQARWIGKNKFISGNFVRRIKSIIIFNPISTILVGAIKSIIFMNLNFFIFKIVYNTAVFLSVLKSYFKEKKYK